MRSRSPRRISSDCQNLLPRDLHDALCRGLVYQPNTAGLIVRLTGLVMPAAYGVARKDASALTFGHVNAVGAVRPLPAVVLASVCGYVATTGVHRLNRVGFAEVIERLSPAEAATHIPHPNLWSWRELLTDAGADSTFLAFFVAAVDDPPVDQDDAQFRHLLAA